MRLAERFGRLARRSAAGAGSPITFCVAITIVLAWAITGPLFRFSDTWQLVINTGTTIITFLMVFLIQNTQNRDSVAMQIKLDELIRAVEGAQNALVDLEELTEEELTEYKARYAVLAARARSRTGAQADCPDLPEAAATSGP
jgi:low affinity Fe/Cu permease